jgi:hypothetical protein
VTLPTGEKDLSWLDSRLEGAPEVLGRRVRELALEAGAGGQGNQALVLGRAATQVLRGVMTHAGDRAIALDLLAADGLITLALLAQAEHDPAHLAAFASGLLTAPRDS